MSRQAMQQALDALKKNREIVLRAAINRQKDFPYMIGADLPLARYDAAITAIEQELAKPAQEPVAWLHPDKTVDVAAPTNLGNTNGLLQSIG